MLEQTIEQIYDVAIKENKICVYEGSSAENIPNYEADFVLVAIRAIGVNPAISEIDLVGMSDNTIKNLIPSISALKNLQRLSLHSNYIVADTVKDLVAAIYDLPITSLALQGNEFLEDQNKCPFELARVLLELPASVSISVYDDVVDQRVKLMADAESE